LGLAGDAGYDSSERRISSGFETREASRRSFRSVLVCSHMTLSVELENSLVTPQCLQEPTLSRPFGASMIQWWTQLAILRVLGALLDFSFVVFIVTVLRL
jgi:hypothetical protein